MYVVRSVSVRGRRVGWHAACETVGRFRPRMPSLGACGAVGPEIRVEVLLPPVTKTFAMRSISHVVVCEVELTLGHGVPGMGFQEH